MSDRWRRHKEVAIAGFGLSTLTRLTMPLAGGALTGMTAAVMADRVGNGIRTAPRDAMISLTRILQEAA